MYPHPRNNRSPQNAETAIIPAVVDRVKSMPVSVVKHPPVGEPRSHRGPKNSRIFKGVLIGLLTFTLGIVGFIVFSGLLTHSKPSFPFVADSGVAACKTIVNNAAKPSKVTNNSTPMTKAQADKASKPFADSRYADVKIAGTNFITSLYTMDNKLSTATGDDAFGTAMLYMTQLQSEWTQLQMACGNHGVTVPPLPIS